MNHGTTVLILCTPSGQKDLDLLFFGSTLQYRSTKYVEFLRRKRITVLVLVLTTSCFSLHQRQKQQQQWHLQERLRQQ